MPTFTMAQIEEAASEMSECSPWGYKEYVKQNGQWVVSHLLIVDEEKRISYKVYPDARATETISWRSKMKEEGLEEEELEEEDHDPDDDLDEDNELCWHVHVPSRRPYEPREEEIRY